MNSRYTDMKKQAYVKRALGLRPPRKLAEEPLDCESMSPGNSSGREGPGCRPLRVKCKKFNESIEDEVC